MSNDREELNTASMLENGFWENFNKMPKKPESMHKMAVKSSVKETTIVPPNCSTEKLLVSLFEIRDDMIDQISEMDINSDLVQKMSYYINGIGQCIKDLGGDVEVFEPINHVSGLQIPSLIKNAERVIDNTIQCYKMGEITKTLIKNNNKTIDIFFRGQTSDTSYDVEGSITSLKVWTGNEAIDYIYTKGSGKMFVRAFEDGKWVDKSDQFEICWELNETPNEQIVSTNKNAKKEEVLQSTANNKVDEDMGADFDIKEKT